MTRDPTGRRPVAAGLSLPALGFGTTTLGGMFRAVSDEEARRAVDAAWDAGLRFFDTAPQYGCGLAERRLGAALSRRPRDEYVLSTKVGKLVVPPGSGGDPQPMFVGAPADEILFDFSADGTRRSIDASLERLGHDRIDIALIHDVTRHFHGEDGVWVRYREALAGAIPALRRLKQEGVIRAFGIGLKDVDVAIRFVEEAGIDFVLLPARLTLLDQSGLEGLPQACAAHGVGILAAGAFDSGILATGAVAGATYGYREADAAIVARVRAIEAACARHAVPLPAAALQFPLLDPAVATVLAGMRSPDEVRQNLVWMRQPIPPSFWEDLQSEGLVRLPR